MSPDAEETLIVEKEVLKLEVIPEVVISSAEIELLLDWVVSTAERPGEDTEVEKDETEEVEVTLGESSALLEVDGDKPSLMEIETLGLDRLVKISFSSAEAEPSADETTKEVTGDTVTCAMMIPCDSLRDSEPFLDSISDVVTTGVAVTFS